MSEITESIAVLFVDIAGSTALRADLGDDAAERRIGGLLSGLSKLCAARSGEVVKSDGDDLLAVFRGAAAASAAAQAAVAAQREARRHGLALYAGLCLGPVRTVEVLGHSDIAGLSVNLAARLHKLLPDEPGFIFLDGTTVAALAPELQSRCRSFGNRNVKGIGAVEVYSIDWDERRTVVATRLAVPASSAVSQTLNLRIGTLRRSFVPDTAGDGAATATGPQPSVAGAAQLRVGNLVSVGRSSRCDLVVDTLIVSSRHVEFIWEGDTWAVRDLGRNGTWARLAGSSAEFQLQGRLVPLGSNGLLCLGQRFELDPQGESTIEFSQTPTLIADTLPLRGVAGRRAAAAPQLADVRTR